MSLCLCTICSSACALWALAFVAVAVTSLCLFVCVGRGGYGYPTGMEPQRPRPSPSPLLRARELRRRTLITRHERAAVSPATAREGAEECAEVGIRLNFLSCSPASAASRVPGIPRTYDFISRHVCTYFDVHERDSGGRGPANAERPLDFFVFMWEAR